MLTWIYLLNHYFLIGGNTKYEILRYQSGREKDFLLLLIIIRSLGATLILFKTSFRIVKV